MRLLALASFLLLLPVSACTDTTGETPNEPAADGGSATIEEPEQPPVEEECTADGDCANGQSCVDGQCLTPSSSGETYLCSSDDPCPAGQFCFNGLCAIGCLSNGDCAADQYCDTEGSGRCVNREVTTCPQSPCESNQDCVDGYCVATATPASCTPSADGNDGCDDYSLCLDFSDTDSPDYRCTSFPACPADGACPTGEIGAVCNDGHIPGKGRICLSGLCDVVDNCPANAACVDVNAPLGFCSDGRFGSVCTEAQDVCGDGLECLAPLPSAPGFCFEDVTAPPQGLCDDNTPCPSNQFCLNGLCAIGCLSNGDCQSDEYCDLEGTGLCAPAVIAPCPQTPCADNQQCRDGLCVQVQVQTCTPSFDGNDGCDADSLCLDQADIDASEPDYRCTTLPPCPEDGVCPTEQIGAVCNDGYLEGKSRFCLTGLCATEDNCETDFSCIDLDGPLGACSDGSLGMLCTDEQDVCQEGTSCQSLLGNPGICAPGGIGPGGDSCQDLGGACVDAFDCNGFPIVEATDCGFSEVCCPL